MSGSNSSSHWSTCILHGHHQTSRTSKRTSRPERDGRLSPAKASWEVMFFASISHWGTVVPWNLTGGVIRSFISSYPQGPFLLHDSHWQFQENRFYAKLFPRQNYSQFLTKKSILWESDHAICWGWNQQLEIFSVTDASHLNCPSFTALVSFIFGVTVYDQPTDILIKIQEEDNRALGSGMCPSDSTRLSLVSLCIGCCFAPDHLWGICIIFLRCWIISFICPLFSFKLSWPNQE